MTTLIIIQLIIAVFLVVLILLQGSDNEGLGFGSGGALGGMMSVRGSANLLSRLTAITATLFMIMSVGNCWNLFFENTISLCSEYARLF